MGIPKSRIRVAKKSDILSGIIHFLPQILWVFSKSRVRVGSGTYPTWKSRVRVAQKRSDSGRVPENSGTRSTTSHDPNPH